MKTIRIMTACAAALLLSSCLQVDEPAGIEAIRNAKAELISAEAQYKVAEIAYLNAQTAYQQALADAQVLENKLKELQLAKETAESEQHIAEIERQMELALLEHQTLLNNAKLEAAIAEQELADALAALAEEAKGISPQEERVLNGYIDKLSSIQSEIANYQAAYETAVSNYMDAKYDFDFDYETYKAKYQYDILVAEQSADYVNEFAEIVNSLSSSDYLTQIAELEAQLEAEESAIAKLEEALTLYEATEKAPLVEQMLVLDNTATENATKIADLQLQQKHLFTDNEKYYRLTVEVPDALATEIRTWFQNYNYLDNASGFVQNHETGTWTTANKAVIVEFEANDPDDYPNLTQCISALENGDMADFLNDLNALYSSYKDYEGEDAVSLEKKGYAAKAQKYVDDFKALVVAAKTASDNLGLEIDKLEATALDIALQKSTIETQLSKVEVALAAKQKEINNRRDVYEGVEMLKSTYEGLIAGTEIVYPTFYYYYNDGETMYEFNVNDLLEPDNWGYGYYGIRYVSGTIGDRYAESVEDLLNTWKTVAAYWVSVTNAAVSKAQQTYDDYCTADSPTRFAQQIEVDAAEMALTIAKAQYDYYAAQFELYTKLFNEYLATVTGTSNSGGAKGGEEA